MPPPDKPTKDERKQYDSIDDHFKERTQEKTVAPTFREDLVRAAFVEMTRGEAAQAAGDDITAELHFSQEKQLLDLAKKAVTRKGWRRSKQFKSVKKAGLIK